MEGKKFEEKLQRIREITEAMDSTETSLDDMIKLYEEGMALAGECKGFLENAEMKIVEINKKMAASAEEEE